MTSELGNISSHLNCYKYIVCRTAAGNSKLPPTPPHRFMPV